MYEASFGLKRRPFAATPDATCFLSAAPIQAALDELVVCVEQGQGIGVLTAPAGTGKTLLCERLRFELGERFETVLLRHASFLTRRALLQTILCELNHSYHHPSEQELRLELFPTIRALAPKREALVLICDEAHQLSDSLLEELRILADFAESGRPLVRLILVGQPSLEEKLAEPGLAAFNQRIRAQLSLSPFDHSGSLDYIDYRLTWAGGRTDEVFSHAAVDLIAKASDGVPRCINQLADHTLLLAFVSEERPASEQLVREALADLRQLPLQWNEPSPAKSLADHSSRELGTISYADHLSSSSADLSQYLKDTSIEQIFSLESASPESSSSRWSSIELGTIEPPPVPQTSDTLAASPSAQINSLEVGSEEWRQTVESFDPHAIAHEPSVTSEDLESQAATDDRFSVQLSRRMRFHDLLQDAYAAAGELLSTSPTDSADEDRQIENSSMMEAPQVSVPMVETLESHEIATVSVSRSSTVQITSSVYEEVIVDRYASIDAGFAPPQAGDTEKPSEVQVLESHSDSELGTAFVSEADSVQDVPSVPYDGPICEQPCHESSTSSETDSNAISSAFGADYVDEPTVDDLPLPAGVAEEPTATDFPVSSILRETVEVSTVSRVVTTVDNVERVADEVFALGQSLHPTGVLSPNSESILKALRREVADLGTYQIAESGHQTTPAPQQPWQSIETVPTESTGDARPFRYLFSLLRRKQQGLA